MNNKCEVKDYCTGCGLCKSEGIRGEFNEKGFYRPADEEIFNGNLDSRICPYTNPNKMIDKYDSPTDIWGDFKSVYLGHSTDEQIRHDASSGGVITTIAIYLLDTNRVDGVLHIGTDSKDQIKTKLYCSTTPQQVKSHVGSRYTSSAPLLNIKDYLNDDKKYAFIGKPCDVVALKNFMEIYPKYNTTIPYMISFFCAGTPSVQANEMLLSKMRIERNKLEYLSYRGNGWPGYATAKDNEGHYESMEYEKSWGGILGRDLQKICRFCWDGTGEVADISCGDAWYLVGNKPDFSEHSGRNVIFSRSDIGEKLLNEIIKTDRLEVENFNNNLEDLKYMQYYQHTRKATMFSKVLAMKIMGKSVPKYSLRKLLKYSTYVPFKRNARMFYGTIKRIIDKKI